jgi:hypothetical protein
MRHFDTLKEMVGTESQEFLGLLKELADKMQATFGKMPQHEFVLLRQTLLGFLQNRRVKVSLFLQDRIQNADGSFIVPCSGALPKGFESPGTIRYFKEGAEINRESLTLASTGNWEIGPAVKPNLGTNLYARDRASGKYASNSPSEPVTPQQLIGAKGSPDPNAIASSICNSLPGDPGDKVDVIVEDPGDNKENGSSKWVLSSQGCVNGEKKIQAINGTSPAKVEAWAEKVDGPSTVAVVEASGQEDIVPVLEPETPTAAAGQQLPTASDNHKLVLKDI